MANQSKINWGARTWSPSKDEELANLYNRRLPMEVLVNNLGVCSTFISRRIKELKLHRTRPHIFRQPLAKKYKFKLDPIAASKIRMMSARGQSVGDIAHKFGVSRKTVYRVIKEEIWRNGKTSGDVEE